MQVLDIRKFKNRAKQRADKAFDLRGEIIDRKGLKLASDKTTFALYAHPKYYDHTPQELAHFLSPIINMPYDTLVSKLSNKNSRTIVIKKEISRKTAESIKKMGYREFSFDAKNKRTYPQGILASHVLGYYNQNADIAAGVEQTAKNLLEYSDKSITYERTGDGDIIYTFSTNPEDLTAPKKGETLQLTIDSAIQHVCEKYLYKKVQETGAKRGAAIVMDPTNGEILAMAIYPYYDPNEYSKYSEELKNWALTDVYPPGSTFKVITVVSGLISGKINKNSRIQDTGKMKVGWWEIKNYDYDKFPNPGLIDLVYLFVHSSNVGSAKIAMMLGDQEFYDILKMLNFGSKTGIDLPGESSGLLPSPKRWDSATHAAMGYGYGASVTAIQMVSAVSAIANKGVWVTPHVIKYSPEEAEEKIARRRVMEEQTAADLTDLLVKSVDKG
jgi:cell division protein FtsI/penicillin-binding protein 2